MQKIPDIIHQSWHKHLQPLFDDEKMLLMKDKILPTCNFYPNGPDIFKVFQMPLEDIKVVILGQDPYPTPGDAIGRAFAIQEGKKRIPVSLRNIQTEIYESGQLSDMVINSDKWITLEHWQEQGVFLLNTALTVESGKAGSHLKYWEDFTKRVISHISNTQPCIWLLWGKKAEMFKPYINNIFNVQGYDSETIESIPINSDWNYVLTAPHPAAEAYSGGKAGFFGSNHFKYTNSILKQMNNKEIKW